MSIPLPPALPFASFHNAHHNENTDHNSGSLLTAYTTNQTFNENVKAWELYLDGDERWEVYQVKAKERPHLLNCSCPTSHHHNHDHNHQDHNQEHNHNESTIIATTDGCDIPGWRKERIMEPTANVEAVLNIGASCFYVRRDRQWPIVKSSSTVWNTLYHKLMQPPTKLPHSIDYVEACQEYKPGMTLFAARYEQTNTPVVITNATTDWKAMPNPNNKLDTSSQSNTTACTTHGWTFTTACTTHGWTFDSLLRRFPNIQWRFSDTHGQVMSLRTYAKYIHGIEGMTDDAPLGIYDALFGEEEPTNALLQEYTVPLCFSHDLFAYAATNDDDHNDHDEDNNDNDKMTENNSNKHNNNHDPNEDHECDDTNSTTSHSHSTCTTFTKEGRPPYRWILIGPPRSGTGLHIDPLWTNAWVTVLQGCKRWMLFPKETPPELIGLRQTSKSSSSSTSLPQIPSIVWFRDYYDIVTAPNFPYPPVEILQQPGETVFVPNGWPHLVLNLELTVAVTHNYASEYGSCSVHHPDDDNHDDINHDDDYSLFLRMWQQVVMDEPKFARQWYIGLQHHRPDLAHRIQEYHMQQQLRQRKHEHERQAQKDVNGSKSMDPQHDDDDDDWAKHFMLPVS